MVSSKYVLIFFKISLNFLQNLLNFFQKTLNIFSISNFFRNSSNFLQFFVKFFHTFLKHFPKFFQVFLRISSNILQSIIKRKSPIWKRNISKNTKMELSFDSYIKFKVESVPSIHSSQNNFLPPFRMSLNFAIWIKTQYLPSNLCQNAITAGVVWKIVQYFFFFLQ